MAENVNLRVSEYETIITEITNMHTTQLQNIRDIINEINTTVTSSDMFNVNLTSQKIVDMLAVIAKEIVVFLDEIFDSNEKSIVSMIMTIEAIDSAGE